MAFRNPNEGMAKFLSSIGDMRRMWEQEEQVRQQQARAAEQHQAQMKEAAQRLVLNQNTDERANLSANAQRLLDPLQRQDYTGRITNNELEAAGRRTTNATDRAKYEQYLKDLAPGGWMETERDLTKKGKLADITQSNAAAGASGASAALARAQAGRVSDEADRNMYLRYTPYGDTGFSIADAIEMGERGLPGGIDRESAAVLNAILRGTDPADIDTVLSSPKIQALLPAAIAGRMQAAGAPAPGGKPGYKPPAKPKKPGE